MREQSDTQGQEQKQHKSFRFAIKTSKQLKEVANLFGRSETAMLEQIIDTYYAKRVEYFEQDRKERLGSTSAK